MASMGDKVIHYGVAILHTMDAPAFGGFTHNYINSTMCRYVVTPDHVDVY